jgi:hypothetical protein
MPPALKACASVDIDRIPEGRKPYFAVNGLLVPKTPPPLTVTPSATRAWAKASLACGRP